MEIVETKLPCTMSSPQLARAFLRSVLQTWRLDGLGETTELLVTELVANVVTHVGAPMTVRVRRGSSTVRVEIDDPSSALPFVCNPGVADEHGRGMLLVDHLADAWGVDIHRGGKTVWFEVDLAAAPVGVHAGSAR